MCKLIQNLSNDKDLSAFFTFVIPRLNDTEISDSEEKSAKEQFLNFTIKSIKTNFLDLAELKELFCNHFQIDELLIITNEQKDIFFKEIFEFSKDNQAILKIIGFFEQYYFKINKLITEIITEKKLDSYKLELDSELKVVNSSIRKDSERLKVLIQATSKIIWVADAEGRIIEDSEGWRDFTGQTTEELMGWGWVARVHPDDQENVTATWLNDVKNKRVAEIEYRLKRADEKYSYVLTRGVPVFDEQNNIREWIGTVTDITESKLAQFKLIEENRINETLFRVGILISAELDIEKLIQSVTFECKNIINAEFAVFLYSISEKEEEHVLYTSSGIRREEYKDFELPGNTKIFNETFKNGNTLRLDDVTEDLRYGTFDYIPSDNKIKSYMAVPVISISGDIIGGLFFGHTKQSFFTEKDEKVVSGIVSQTAVAIDNASLYQKTNEAVAQFSLLTDTVPEIIWTADPDGYRDYFNNNWYKYTGLDFDSSKGWNWKNVIHPDDILKSMEKWNNSIATGETYESIYRKKSKAGIYHWFLGRALPLKNDEGKIIKWFGTSTDIDNQKKTEEELERSNKELQQFAFISSHDLQEPLRVVTSYIQLISKKYKEKIDKEADEFITFAVEGVTRMQALIDDLQSYSNIIQKEINYSPVDMEDILSRTIESLKNQIEASNAIITHEHLPVINADESNLLLLFKNLLSNSLKYCSRQPKIHLSAELKYGEWLFTFKDNGIGIEPEYYDKIFLIFQRLHNRSIYQGTGMGLAICKKIVEKHKGNIWVKSEYNEGSVFNFTIPAIII